MSRPAPLAVVAGGLAQRPGAGGHAWVFLNWLLGLQSLGYDVLFVDRLDHRTQGDPGDSAAGSAERAWLCRVMVGAGLEGKFVALGDDGLGTPDGGRLDVIRRCRRARVLFNIMGYLDDEALLASISGPKVFVDIDPGFPQMWHALGLCDLFDGHDAFVTVGLGVGGPRSTVPTCERRWITTPPPVALEAWPRVEDARPPGTPRVTTVATWRGPNGPIEYEGVTYGLRVHEQRIYATLPRRVPCAALEIALDIDPADASDAASLRRGGWRLSDPRTSTGTTGCYRKYIQGSDAEFTVAKNMYVRSRGGWFSDRSACYLASGRPVVAQDTGYSAHLPVGKGLVPFSNVDEAVDGLGQVTSDLMRHRRAAREIALEHLDARRVLAPILDAVGAS